MPGPDASCACWRGGGSSALTGKVSHALRLMRSLRLPRPAA
jgi:hypothetical protein